MGASAGKTIIPDVRRQPAPVDRFAATSPTLATRVGGQSWTAMTTARDALSAWLHYLAHERRASPRTLEAYGDNLRRYLGFLEQHQGGAVAARALADVTAAEVRAYLAFRRQGPRPLSPRSLSQSLSSIRSFHRWLDRRCGISNDALALVRGPRIKPGAPRPVSEDQARGLIGEAEMAAGHEDWESARDAALLTLLYG